MPRFSEPVISIGANGGVVHNIGQEYNLTDAAVRSDVDAGSGVLGTSSRGFGVVGITGPIQSNVLSSAGNAGVCGVSSGAPGVVGKSASLVGVWGQSTNSPGVLGESFDSSGVFGRSTNQAGVRADSPKGPGVWAESNTGNAVFARSSTGAGVRAISNAEWLLSSAVVGESQNRGGCGVFGWATGELAKAVVGFGGATGVWGLSTNGNGSQGQSTNGSGVFGTSSAGPGVRGESSTGPGVYGHSYTGKAGVFEGDVQVTGTLFKGNLAFKIDHPLDPQNKYLYHAGVESPDMKNIYDGIAELDAKGQAVVKLPAWFEALNKNFRYQLTPLGDSSPDLHIAKEIEGNRFVIGGGKPRMRVCWQVTGIRQDAFANANRLPVEENKPAKERGLFLHPEPFKQSEKKRIPLGGDPESFAKAEKDFAQMKKDLDKEPKKPAFPEPKSQRKPKKGRR
jgi:hypothetical protein